MTGRLPTFVALSLTFLTGCSLLTNPAGRTITGKVSLEGQTDHSGVEVSLYLPAELDTSIVGLNQRYPNVGLLISQETEFDHRFAVEVMRTRTGRDGSFELRDVEEGAYVLVVEKEGFGWQYIFDVPMNDERRTINELLLLQERKVEGVLTEDTVWERGRHYVVEEDVTVPYGVTLTIEAGVTVRFEGYFRLIVQGRLQAVSQQDAMITFTSGREEPQRMDWREIELQGEEEGSPSVLRGIRVEWAGRGIYCKGASPVIEGSVVRECPRGGIVVNASSSPRIEGNLILGCGTVIDVEVNSDPVIYGNMIMGNDDRGISVKLSSSPRIENNWIARNPTGIYAQYNSDLLILHNRISDGKTGLAFIDNSYATLKGNTLERQSDMGVHIYDCRYPPNLSGNNIVESGRWHVYLLGRVSHDMDATGNWWGTTNAGVIASKIRDGRDLPLGSEEQLGVVKFEPFEREPVEGAGIR